MTEILRFQPDPYLVISSPTTDTDAENILNYVAKRRYEWTDDCVDMGGKYVLDHVINSTPSHLFIFSLKTWCRG